MNSRTIRITDNQALDCPFCGPRSQKERRKANRFARRSAKLALPKEHAQAEE